MTQPERSERITHGRHCICSACAAEDWSNPELAPCGMHGRACAPAYQPWGLAGQLHVVVDDDPMIRAVLAASYSHEQLRAVAYMAAGLASITAWEDISLGEAILVHFFPGAERSSSSPVGRSKSSIGISKSASAIQSKIKPVQPIHDEHNRDAGRRFLLSRSESRCPECGQLLICPAITKQMVEEAWGAYVHPGDDASEAEELSAMRVALEAARKRSPR